ncbi:MAG: hypothetical protein IPL39_16295 [Opitutaceae bacterium]|nr:hypothetical protein [Opitutaceae bacterium]
MPLIDYLRPDYPTQTVDSGGIRRTYAMRGPTATLAPLVPGIGAAFEGNLVEATSSNKIGTSAFSDVIVSTMQSFATATAEVTDDQYPFFEIDQVQIEKNLRQHPVFAGFQAGDWAAVTAWEAELEATAKSNFQFYFRTNEGQPTGSLLTLAGTETTGAKAFARLRLRGVESFLDFAPVVRRTTRYRGSAAPSSADAGQKSSAPPYAPAGYEWLKTTDRVSNREPGQPTGRAKKNGPAPGRSSWTRTKSSPHEPPQRRHPGPIDQRQGLERPPPLRPLS